MGAMRKIRLPRNLNEPTCKITDSASITKIPPTNTSSTSCLMITATVPSVPPSASEPTSPMNTSAGCALYQRNPSDAPNRQAVQPIGKIHGVGAAGYHQRHENQEG